MIQKGKLEKDTLILIAFHLSPNRKSLSRSGKINIPNSVYLNLSIPPSSAQFIINLWEKYDNTLFI
jgi:hypothetical protein